MLTRLKVSGFKNLVDVDVRFGPFTCLAGANGTGKSNLFDAIKFLSVLAEYPLVEAALCIRAEGRRTGDVRSLFHRIGNNYANQMSFEAEMIIPSEGFDDLGQHAEASITFLRYLLVLAYQTNGSTEGSRGPLEVVKEELIHLNLGEANKRLLFPHKMNWRKSVVKGRRASAFISTEYEDKHRLIKLHQDGGNKGRAKKLLAVNLPRTVLSSVNAAESPTALLAKREMQSWRLLQLEPSALRKPDEFSSPTKLGSDGSHLAAALNHLAQEKTNGRSDEAQVYTQVANRLSELIDDVRDVWIDRDEKRELLTLQIIDHNGTPHPSKALSDGTLRFLALTVLEMDTEEQGLLCLEEPENGIHPERIPAMLQLLQDICTDVEEEIGSDNPLRQVIINTHSPAVVSQVLDENLVIAELRETIKSNQRFKSARFSCLPDTWRHLKPVEGEKANVVSRGKLLTYLNPVPISQDKEKPQENKKRRVIDREELRLQYPLPFLNEQNDRA